MMGSNALQVKEFDWAGSWFPIMERLGEATDMLFAKIDANGVPHWHVLSHTETDGIGAMALLLNDPLKAAQALKLTKYNEAPGIFKVIISIYRHACMVRDQKTLWKYYDPIPVGPSPTLAWSTFDIESTKQIGEFARSQKVSVNTFLLYALDHAARSLLIDGGTTRWGITVNMRGAQGVNPDGLNQFSAIHVLNDPTTKLEEFHGRIRKKFKEANHWASWTLMHVGKLIGLERAENYLKESYKHPRPATGSISSLGEWESERIAPNEAWIVFAVVSKMTPLGAVSLTVNGKLSITLQVHPTLHPTRDSIRGLMQAWVQSIQKLSGAELRIPELLSVEAISWQNAKKLKA